MKEHTEIVTGLQFSNHSESRLFSSSLDRTIKVWSNYKCIHTFSDHQDWIRSLSLSKNDHTLISGCVSGNILIWDAEQGGLLGTVASGTGSLDYLNSINCLKFSNNREELFLAG